MGVSIMMRAGVCHPESGGYVWSVRGAMGKQILSIWPEGFFYVGSVSSDLGA